MCPWHLLLNLEFAEVLRLCSLRPFLGRSPLVCFACGWLSSSRVLLAVLFCLLLAMLFQFF